MNRHTTFVVLAVVAAALASTACSDDSSTASSTTSTPPATATTVAVPTTTESPIVTSVLPISTTSASTTTTVDTSTTAAGASTTTVDEIAATKAAIAAAAVQSRQDYLYAIVNYDAPEALAVLGKTTAVNSPSFELGQANMAQLRSKGWRAKADPNVPSVLMIEGDITLLDGPPATKAQLTACTIDSGIIYEAGAAPDGSDTIVNDQVTARRDRITMVLEGGAWKLYDGAALGTWKGQTTCPAA